MVGAEFISVLGADQDARLAPPALNHGLVDNADSIGVGRRMIEHDNPGKNSIRFASLNLVALLCVFLTCQALAESGKKVISWNAYSKQFIDAPAFRLLPIQGASAYRAIVNQGGHCWKVESTRPEVSLAGSVTFFL